MKTIGLVGGVASGKSLVARMLVELGAGLLDADRTGHDVLAGDAQVHHALRQQWGDAVFTADGSVDRPAIAARVFAQGAQAAADRRWLESVLHPQIRQQLEKLRDQLAAEGRPAAVLDAPLLLEAGWGPMCELLLMVDASRDVRLERARQRGWSEAEFARREAAQWPVEDKRREATVLVTNDGTEHDLRDAIRALWNQHVAR